MAADRTPASGDPNAPSSGQTPLKQQPEGGRLRLGESLLASAVAVVGATALTHPIDVVKVRLQVSEQGSAKADSFSLSRFARFWPDLYRREGLSPFFAGVRAASVRAATYGGPSSSVGCAHRALRAVAGSPASLRFGALSSGVLATILGNPFEVLKVRLQSQPAGGSEVRALVAMVRNEGLGVLARGFHWAAARSAVLTASQVVPYDAAKATLRARAGLRDGVGLHFLASLAAGVATSTATAPLDVLKTRVMSAAHGKTVSLSAMLRAEGPFVFFKGWLANYVRIGPQTLFILVFSEQTRLLVKKLRAWQ